jgi:hypothetical protein
MDVPQGKWPTDDCGPVSKCSLFSNQTLPTTVRRCSILVSKSCYNGGCGSKSTRIRGGDCHPNYVFCEETQTCQSLLYSACGYSEWLRNFRLEECIKESPSRFINQCVQNYLKDNGTLGAEWSFCLDLPEIFSEK